MYRDRKAIYQELEKKRKSRVLVYVTGDRQGRETKIHREVLRHFSDHLEIIGTRKRVSLVLYTRGGDTLAGWGLVNLIREYCEDFEVLVPAVAHSTGTLICIGANKILMTRHATLGPIDPSINSPLNPQVPGGPPNQRLPVSVEDVAGYLELAKSEKNLNTEGGMKVAFEQLASNVHPLALGSVFRARSQIQMLARKLLEMHLSDADTDNEKKITQIIAVLCGEAGSHDYTISRREALEDLMLPVEKPSGPLNTCLNAFYADIKVDLELTNRFNPDIILGAEPTVNYSHVRALVESVQGGSHQFLTEGTFKRVEVDTPAGPQPGVEDRISFDGWRLVA